MAHGWSTYRWRLAVAGPLACTVGCLTSPNVAQLVPQAWEPAPVAAAKLDTADSLVPPPAQSTATASTSTLDMLLAQALARHPELAAAHARAEAARGEHLQASLYPNPVVGWEGEEMGSQGGRAGLQGPFVEQRIVLGGKLDWASAVAAEGVTMADWSVATRRLLIVAQVRAAYYDLLGVKLEQQALAELVRVVEDVLQIARAAERAGTGARPDVLRAELALQQRQLRLATTQVKAQTALRVLAAATGGEHTLDLVVPAGERLDTPEISYGDLVARLERSTEIAEAQAAARQAAMRIQLEYATAKPDLTVRVRPLYSDPNDLVLVTAEAGVTLPLFNRNQGNILAAGARRGALEEEVRAVRLRLEARLARAFERYQAARRQAAIYEQEIMPRTREALRLVEIGYRAGDAKFDFDYLIATQEAAIEARLGHVQSTAEAWRGLAEIAEILQWDAAATPPPTR